MKKGVLILSVLAAFVLTTAMPGQAQRYWQQRMRPGFGMDLTEEQISQIQEMRLAFHKEILPLQSQIQTHYLELRGLYLKDTEQEKIDAKLAQIDKLEQDLDEKFLAHQNQVRELLTDEQKAVFDRWGGLGLGMGGMGFGMGPRMRGGRGFAGFNRGLARSFGRGFDRGFSRGAGRAWMRGMGRGYRCPWYRPERFRMMRNWW